MKEREPAGALGKGQRHLLYGDGLGQQSLGLVQLLPLLQDVAQVVHGVDVGRVKPGQRQRG